MPGSKRFLEHGITDIQPTEINHRKTKILKKADILTFIMRIGYVFYSFSPLSFVPFFVLSFTDEMWANNHLKESSVFSSWHSISEKHWETVPRKRIFNFEEFLYFINRSGFKVKCNINLKLNLLYCSCK